MVRRHGPEGQLRTRHLSGNLRIGADGDGAWATSSAVVFQATAALPLQPVLVARYSDRFVRDLAGRPRFARREMRMDLTGNLDEHLARPVGP